MRLTKEMQEFLDIRVGSDLIKAIYDLRVKFNLTDHDVYDVYNEWAEGKWYGEEKNKENKNVF